MRFLFSKCNYFLRRLVNTMSSTMEAGSRTGGEFTLSERPKILLKITLSSTGGSTATGIGLQQSIQWTLPQFTQWATFL